MRSRKKRSFVVRRLDQLKALRSPIRQEIVDAAVGNGPCSVRDLAEMLGRPADALYYHVRKLQRVGLLTSAGRRTAQARVEEVVEAPGRPVALPEQGLLPSHREATQEIIGAMLRLTARQHAAAIRREVPPSAGRTRWASRVSGWLSDAEVRALMNDLHRWNTRIQRRKRGKSRGLFAFTFAVLPLTPVVRRRSHPRSAT